MEYLAGALLHSERGGWKRAVFMKPSERCLTGLEEQRYLAGRLRYRKAADRKQKEETEAKQEQSEEEHHVHLYGLSTS
jgi:hypothetical protein